MSHVSRTRGSVVFTDVKPNLMLGSGRVDAPIHGDIRGLMIAASRSGSHVLSLCTSCSSWPFYAILPPPPLGPLELVLPMPPRHLLLQPPCVRPAEPFLL